MNWPAILTRLGVRPVTADEWGPVFADTIRDDTFSAGPSELPAFLGQILVESKMLEKLSENLNYSAERLCAVWPGRFPTLESALPYAHNSEALANKVYGGRMGNVEAGDGWRFKGRGIIGLTGRANYAAIGCLMGQDLVDLPELLEQPHYALEAAIHWWEDRVHDSMLGDTVAISRRVNGGDIGMNDRIALTNLAKDVLA